MDATNTAATDLDAMRDAWLAHLGGSEWFTDGDRTLFALPDLTLTIRNDQLTRKPGHCTFEGMTAEQERDAKRGYADGQRDAEHGTVSMFGPADRRVLGGIYCNNYQVGASDFLISIGGTWNSDPRP